MFGDVTGERLREFVERDGLPCAIGQLDDALGDGELVGGDVHTKEHDPTQVVLRRRGHVDELVDCRHADLPALGVAR